MIASTRAPWLALALASAACADPATPYGGGSDDIGPADSGGAEGSTGIHGSTGGGDASGGEDPSAASSSDDAADDSSTGASGCPADMCEADGVCMPCDTSYWAGVDRDVATTPYGHRTAISCHNCYTSTLTGTISALRAAQDEGADLLELDLTDEGGVIVVEHDDGGGADGPALVDVLADPELVAGDQILNIELKETAPTEAFIAGVLDALVASGCVREGRPVMIRAFVSDSRLENLLIAQELLATPAYAELAPHVRIHALLSAGNGNSTATLLGIVDENFERGFDAIEFQFTTPALIAGVHYAESLGLGTSVWTVPPELGEMHVAALRDEVDSITTEYPVASARARVEADNARVYVDATTLAEGATAIDWLGIDAADVTTAEIGNDGRPVALVDAALPGTSLGFVPAESRSLPIADVGAEAGAGVLVAALVRFGDLSPGDGATMTVLGKANAGEYSLELFDPAGAGGVLLRFGVHVGEGYHYASLPVSALQADRAAWIVGAYDGDGAVRLMVDHSTAGTTTTDVTGGVTANDAVLQLGADPQDPDAPRFFFDGAIQTALVQAWP
jgi:glycerophosphoryl diester phosphodiesterase